jgi:hypothetical protein
VGAPLRCGSPDAGSGPSRCFDAFGETGHARKAVKTLRKITWEAKRPPLWQGDTLPGGKEGSLRTQEDGQRGSFAMEIKLIAKLLAVKT